MSGMLATDMVLLSLLARMRLTAMGLVAASVPFTKGGSRAKMELLVGEEARVARRHVAAHTSPDALSALRKKALPESSKSWELLQASLFAGGLDVCPTSGTPVTNVQRCSEELKAALWGGLLAIAKAVNKKDAGDFDQAMQVLATLVQQHAASRSR